LLSPLPLREGERESVCVRECEANRSEAVRVGPAWLQRHGCKFVKGVALEARGSRHAKSKTGGKSDSISMPGRGRAKGNIYATSMLQ
jgi:hypothetical protein